MKPLVAATVIAVALLAGAVRPLPSAAATPCWKALLNDWYDGRIDNTYPLHCYSDALKHLPADVQTYSSAHDDILRALQNAKAELRKEGKTPTPSTPVVPAGSGGKTTSNGDQTTTSGETVAAGGTTTTTTSEPGRNPGGGLGGAAAGLNTSSPSSLPLPLIVLGALALLLVAAGAIGLVAKRRQGPKPGP